MQNAGEHVKQRESDAETFVRVARSILDGSTPVFLGCKLLIGPLNPLGVHDERPFVTRGLPRRVAARRRTGRACRSVPSWRGVLLLAVVGFPPMRRRTSLAVTLVLLTVVAGGGVTWVACVVRTHRAEVSQFREEHSAARIVGKTAEEIIAVYGQPYWQRGPDGNPEAIVYKQLKHGQYCDIELVDGVAVGVYFSFQ